MNNMENIFNMPNFAGEANLMKQRLAMINQKSKIIEQEEVILQHYYKCNVHKKVFCDNCAHNYYLPKVGDLKEEKGIYIKAPECCNIALRREDCILEKKYLEDNQTLECSWCKECIKHVDNN